MILSLKEFVDCWKNEGKPIRRQAGVLMIIDSIDTVVYTFQFIVPGYVISEVIGAIMPRKKYSEGERIVQVIGYSVFNMGVWYWLFKLI